MRIQSVQSIAFAEPALFEASGQARGGRYSVAPAPNQRAADANELVSRWNDEVKVRSFRSADEAVGYAQQFLEKNLPKSLWNQEVSFEMAAIVGGVGVGDLKFGSERGVRTADSIPLFPNNLQTSYHTHPTSARAATFSLTDLTRTLHGDSGTDYLYDRNTGAVYKISIDRSANPPPGLDRLNDLQNIKPGQIQAIRNFVNEMIGSNRLTVEAIYTRPGGRPAAEFGFELPDGDVKAPVRAR
jgi:hypothetical protein